MNKAEFNNIKEALRVSQDVLLETKGKDYTRSNPDVLINFKRAADDLGINVMQAWGVHACKQWDAIMAYVKTGKLESEDLRHRFVDLKNYLILGYAIYTETPEARKDSEAPF